MSIVMHPPKKKGIRELPLDRKKGRAQIALDKRNRCVYIVGA
jgi:hypothetical protein